ncbi:WSC domain-containing protein [Microdochium trichocladiopsis]|uniref:WSC domain-containing protein n=1 Tax=Microdochium trichocladiopsis TaxID=1682393 RepID=A0A9P9BSK6_9PEZI|nr:WSC domain-containing protein [Microdochium trichocladiopsis]KAH7034547.1 WSC domain-containing protein [Microdochium trichocladiopsis]
MPRMQKLIALALLSGHTPLSLASILPAPRANDARSSSGPSPVETSNLPSGWAYTGCFVDSVSNRVLSGAYQPSQFYSRVETCISFCTSQGLPVAGLEYGGECYCATQLPDTAVSDSDGCTSPCRGNATQACGAGNRLSVYSGPGSLVPQVNPGVGGFVSVGCYTDQVSKRTLGTMASVPGGEDAMTNVLCAEACAGKTYYGLEYGGECYCDDEIRNGAALAADGGCNMPCKGNRTELCGGRDRLNLYSKAPDATGPTTTGTSTSTGTLTVTVPNGEPTTTLTSTSTGTTTVFTTPSSTLSSTSSSSSSTSVAPPAPPPNRCPAGKPVNLCCRAIEPWKTNSAIWGGMCGYYPPDGNMLTGAVCAPKQAGTSCASGTKEACCAGTWVSVDGPLN